MKEVGVSYSFYLVIMLERSRKSDISQLHGPKTVDCGLFLHHLVDVPDLWQLVVGHSVTLSYVWHLACSKQASPLKKYNASSQSLSLLWRQRS